MDDITQEAWFDQPTTLGLTIYIEHRPKLGPEPERWTPEQRRDFCQSLRQVVDAYVAEHDTVTRRGWRDEAARVVYQGNNTPDDRLPTSVIVWIDGWYSDPTPEDQFRRSYAPLDPFDLRRHLERHGYHVSDIRYGYDPVMAS